LFRTILIWIQMPYLLRTVAQYKKFANQVINEMHYLAIFLVNMWTVTTFYILALKPLLLINGQHNYFKQSFE